MTRKGMFVFLLAAACVGQPTKPQLVQVQLVHRHGDRAPLKDLPANHVDWFKTLGTQQGQLTGTGLTQAHQLGEWLRSQYIENTPLLSPEYVPSELIVRSTDYDRTIATAQTVLGGLFSNATLHDDVNNRTNRVAIPVHTISTQDDVILRGFNLCGAPLRARIDTVKASSEWQVKEQESQEFLEWFKGVTNFTTIDFENFYDYYDPVFVQYTHGLLPSSIAVRISEIESLASWTEHTRFHAVGNLAGGTLLSSILRNMVVASQHNSRSQIAKFHQFSAHDVTISVLAVALGLDNNFPLFRQIPAYASALIFELWCEPAILSPDDSCRVLVHYRDGVTGNVTRDIVNQTLQDFQNVWKTQSLTTSAWCNACGTSSPGDWSANNIAQTLTPAVCLRDESESSDSNGSNNKLRAMVAAFGAWGALMTLAVVVLAIRLRTAQQPKRETLLHDRV